MDAPVVAPDMPLDDVDAGGPSRLFFALAPSATVRAAFGDLSRNVARRSRGRAVSSDHLHLTLAFLGDVPAVALPALQQVGAGMPRAGAVLVFDTLGAWRASGVAWVAPSVVPSPILALHAALAAALTVAGFALEARAFRPHITLARRCVQVQPRARCEPVRWPADRLCLIGSELGPEGPVYRELGAWPLALDTPAN
jgi:RNA 2',3'-cyclic 3'-phosphodiesterase